MLLDFFLALRTHEVPVSIEEFLDLLEALNADLAFADVDEFYYLSRAILVKDERYFDRFDRTFSSYFEGITDQLEAILAHIPNDWLRPDMNRLLSAEERSQIKALGSMDKLLATLRERLKEQKERHAGGNKWIGTGGTSPFGSGGYHPEGIRFGEVGERQHRAVKVWEQREFRNLDEQSTLSSRNMKMALRRLRHFARDGARQEFDIESTIEQTARDAGILSIQMRAERRNAVKLLILFDIGGSMDAHIQICQELFSACRSELRHLEYFYFHNFVYESVWKDSQCRQTERISTYELLHKYGEDYRLVFVGDASMSPYEIAYPGGSVEHWNEEAGSQWLQRYRQHFSRLIWLNPVPKEDWAYTESINMVAELIDHQMFPLTLEGLEAGMRYLSKG